MWNWFVGCLEKITDDARAEEKKGRPRILLAAPSGCPKVSTFRIWNLILREHKKLFFAARLWTSKKCLFSAFLLAHFNCRWDAHPLRSRPVHFIPRLASGKKLKPKKVETYFSLNLDRRSLAPRNGSLLATGWLATLGSSWCVSPVAWSWSQWLGLAVRLSDLIFQKLIN